MLLCSYISNLNQFKEKKNKNRITFKLFLKKKKLSEIKKQNCSIKKEKKKKQRKCLDVGTTL